MDTPATPRPSGQPGWGFIDLLVISCVFILAVLLAGSAGLWVAHAFPALAGLSKNEIAEHPYFLVPVQAAAYLLTFLFARMHITLKTQQDFWEAVSWDFPATGTAIQLMLTGSALAVVVLIATAYLPVPPDLPVEKYFRIPGAVPVLMAFTVLVAPLAEEIFFRGLMFPVLEQRIGVSPGIVLTSLLFAALHTRQLAGAWAPLLVLFTVGATLNYVRYRRRSLASSWLMHFSYNGTLMLVMFISSYKALPGRG